jgi:hypothetical protein
MPRCFEVASDLQVLQLKFCIRVSSVPMRATCPAHFILDLSSHIVLIRWSVNYEPHNILSYAVIGFFNLPNPILPAPNDRYGDCGAVGGIKIGRGNRSTRRKSTPAPLCPPQIPHDQTRAAAVWSQRLTAWAMARPCTLKEFQIV